MSQVFVFLAQQPVLLLFVVVDVIIWRKWRDLA